MHSEVPDFFGGDAAKLEDYMLFRDGLAGAQRSKAHRGCHRIGPGSGNMTLFSSPAAMVR